MKTKSEHTVTMEIELPEALIWLDEVEHPRTVRASLRGMDAYTGRIAHEKLTVTATSLKSVDDAKNALREWADFVSLKLGEESER